MSKGIQLHTSPTQPNPHSGLPGVFDSAGDKSSSGRWRGIYRRNSLITRLLGAFDGVARVGAAGVGVAVFGLAAVAGCSSDSASFAGKSVVEVGVEAGESVIRVDADWVDVEAAVAVALGKSELVKVRLERPDPSRLIYTLRTSRDEPATLTIDRLDGPETADPVRMRLACRVGRFGDTLREEVFLALVAARLEQLRGVEVAPLK